jgi:hypothetical protein
MHRNTLGGCTKCKTSLFEANKYDCYPIVMPQVNFELNKICNAVIHTLIQPSEQSSVMPCMKRGKTVGGRSLLIIHHWVDFASGALNDTRQAPCRNDEASIKPSSVEYTRPSARRYRHTEYFPVPICPCQISLSCSIRQ